MISHFNIDLSLAFPAGACVSFYTTLEYGVTMNFGNKMFTSDLKQLPVNLLDEASPSLLHENCSTLAKIVTMGEELQDLCSYF